MRGILTLVAAVAAMAVPAAAAGVSDFDGTYTGSFTVKPGFEGAACASQNTTTMHVEKGQIQTSAGGPSFSGTIDGQGNVDGHMLKAGGGDVAFQGRDAIGEYEATPHLRAGVVDTQTGCAWLLDVVRQ